jgi:ribonuclease HI
MRPAPIKIYFDGGCRPNPGQMETAVVARGVCHHRPDCGVGGSNDAEWLALIHAAEIARSIGARNVVMLGDSAFVVAGASGKTKCRTPEFQAYFERFLSLTAGFERIRIRKIARTQNLAGIALANARR